MVTMMYPDLTGGDSRIQVLLRAMLSAAATFNGPRSFTYWHVAVAYALLPASPMITQTPRRRVCRLPNGRWSAVQTARPARGMVICTDQVNRDFPPERL